MHLSLIPTNDYLNALDNLRNFVEFPSEPDLICKFESAKRSQKTHFSPFLFHLFIFFTFSLLPFCHRSLIYVCLFHCIFVSTFIVLTSTLFVIKQCNLCLCFVFICLSFPYFVFPYSVLDHQSFSAFVTGLSFFLSLSFSLSSLCRLSFKTL